MDPTEDVADDERCPPEATIEIVNPTTGCPLTGPCEPEAEDE